MNTGGSPWGCSTEPVEDRSMNESKIALKDVEMCFGDVDRTPFDQLADRTGANDGANRSERLRQIYNPATDHWAY